MSNKRKTSQLTMVLILNILLIVGAVLAINRYINTSIDEVVVYKYSKALAADTQITENDLVPVTVSARMITGDNVNNKEEVVGKYTGEKIYAGELVDKRKIVSEGQINPLKTLPVKEIEQMRKISIEVDMLKTWGGSLGKGDRVDLSYTTTLDDQTTYTKIFMQNVLVYDVLSSAGESYIKPEDRPPIVIDESNPQSAELAKAEIERRSDIQMVILAVTPEQYEEIRNRLEVGSVDLVGRFPESKSQKTDGFANQKVTDPVKVGSYKTEDKDTIIIKNPVKTNSSQASNTTNSGW